MDILPDSAYIDGTDRYIHAFPITQSRHFVAGQNPEDIDSPHSRSWARPFGHSDAEHT